MYNPVQNIEITNFKSIKDLKIEGCKKINIFAGKPNAGKSNLLEALSFFDVFFSDKTLKDFIRYNDNPDLFFEGNFLSPSVINLNKEKLYLFYFNSYDSIHVDFFSDKFDYNDKNIIKSKEYNLKGLNLRNEKISISSDFKIKKYNFVDYRFNAKKNDYKSLISPNGNNLSQIITSNPIVRDYVNKLFLDNNLKLLIERNTTQLKIFKEYQDGTIFTLPYTMIADTLQRLIFYKTAIISNENSTLLFEEPEAHCFEPYILEFTNEVKYNKNQNQFFIVTHSDFIIQEFLRDDESRENTQIFLVNNINGETKVKSLVQNKNEDVYELGMNLFFNFDNLWDSN